MTDSAISNQLNNMEEPPVVNNQYKSKNIFQEDQSFRNGTYSTPHGQWGTQENNKEQCEGKKGYTSKEKILAEDKDDVEEK